MNVVIVANGELQANARVGALWEHADLRIAADGGARNAREQLGAPPHVVIGDLDSLDDLTRVWLMDNHAEFIQHPVHKDETDLELAVNLARARGATRLTVLGALGGRPDQALANILLLSRVPDLIVLDAASELWAAEGRATVEGEVGDTVSLIPLDAEVKGLITHDLLYPLQHETLARGSTRGVSNQLTTPRAEIEWEGGLLLVVHLFTSTPR